MFSTYISAEIVHYTCVASRAGTRQVKALRLSVRFTFARTVGALQGRGEGLS